MKMLIMLHKSDDFTTLRTYCRERGRSGYFYITNAAFERWLENGVGGFHDRDGYDSLSIYEDQPGIYRINVVWVTDCGGGNVRGYTQSFRIPKPLLLSVVCGETMDATHFYSEPDECRKSSVHLSPAAHRNVAEMPPHIRRAFSKFMRDHFNYVIPSTISVYADGNADFYFYDESPRGICINGGIILSTFDRRHRNGTNFCHRYSMHT